MEGFFVQRKDFETKIFPKISVKIHMIVLHQMIKLLLAQEPEQAVDECDELQDWRVHGQEENINESEDQFIL